MSLFSAKLEILICHIAIVLNLELINGKIGEKLRGLEIEKFRSCIRKALLTPTIKKPVN